MGDVKKETERLADFLWQEICELPDRSSPEDYPDMGLVNRDELVGILDKWSDSLALRQPDTSERGGEADDWSFQQRVGGWMRECFTPEIIADKLERNDRFIEEALELVQSLGYSADRAHALVDYVFGRPAGEPSQEVGGVMVTLAALCNPNGLNMDMDAEVELARILDPAIVLKIRAKQAAKPTGSALPVPPSSPLNKSPNPEHVEGDVLVGEMKVVAYLIDCPAEPTLEFADVHVPDAAIPLATLSAAQSSIQRAERERDIADRNRDAARDNFLTMQGAAASLLKRATTAEAQLEEARKDADGEVAMACIKCNSPRAVDPCPKCGTALTKPADGWEWPTLPDIDRIRELAREVGYAVGVHGSLERDLDLIAAPWIAEAVGPLELAEHIAYGLGGNVVDFERQDKPCSRWSCNIHTPDWTKMIDLSVMPPAASRLSQAGVRVAVWKSRPQNDLEATIAEFKTALPGWWYSVCECNVSCDASCAPTTESPHINLIETDERGLVLSREDPFDSGFHADLPQPSTLAQALRNVMDQALAEIAIRSLPIDKEGK